MSVEVDTEEPKTPEVLPPAQLSVVALAQRQPIWRRRRYQLTALLVAVAFVAALVGNNLLARQYTPDGAVRQYMAALQSDDAGQAWGVIQVAAPSAPVAATVTDRSALVAALASGRPDIREFTVTGSNQLNSTTSSVDVTYDTAGGTKQVKFIVQRSGQTHFGIYPVWHLLITPTILQVTVPGGSTGVSVDGKAIALPQGKSTIAVLPVVHRVQLSGTAMISAPPATVDAFFSLGQSVAFKPTLTAAGLDKATAAVKAHFDTCSKQTAWKPDGCPQSVDYSLPHSGQWQLVGDPLQDLSVSFDQEMNALGTGHFQMVYAYQEAGTQGTSHWFSSSGYSAALVLAPTDIAVGSISSSDSAPPLVRPAGATDQAAEALVSKAFAQCAAAQSDAPADCPQGFAFVDASSVSWSLSGDPLSGATVSFDQGSGVFTVQGNFNMTSTYYVSGYSSSRPSYTSVYRAFLYWNGQAFELVTIGGYFS
jgi:hypothetical protein